MGLVFDIGDIDRLAWSEELSVPVGRGEALLPFLDSEVLVAGSGADGVPQLAAIGRLGGLAEGEALLTRLRWFVRRLPLPERRHRDSPFLLADEVQAGLVAEGFTVPLAAAEMAASSELSGPPTLESYRALYHAVLRNHGFRCALTGRAFEKSEGLHPALEVVAIRPLEAGGPLHVGNFLPLVPDAAIAFRQLHLTVGADLAIVADLAAIDPELLETLHPSGRLQVFAEPPFDPDPAQLSWHRARFFERLG